MLLLSSVHFTTGILSVLPVGAGALTPPCECKVFLPRVAVMGGLKLLPAVIPPKLFLLLRGSIASATILSC